MRKSILFLAAVAALTLASCVKEAKTPVASSRTITFNALSPESKTVFGDKSGDKYPVLWTSEDTQLKAMVNFSEVSDGLPLTPSADGKSASFTYQFTPKEGTEYRFFFLNPFAAYKSVSATNKTVFVDFPSAQISTPTSPDPSAQILFADSGSLTEIPATVNLTFEHLTAYLHLSFSNVALGDATVQAVNITSPDYYIAGRIYYLPDSDTFQAGTSSIFHTIAITTTSLDNIWVGLCPADFSGKTLDITISTDKGTLKKTITLPASANLIRGKIAKFNVDMEGIAMQESVVYKVVTDASQLHVGDKVIIASAAEDQPYAMSTGQNTNNRGKTGVSKTATEITNPNDEVEIIELEDGFVPGHYAMKVKAGYLYAADGSQNYLRTQDNANDPLSSWAISIENVTIGETTTEGAAVILADGPAGWHGLIRYNATSNLFSAYATSSSMLAVKLYRLDAPAVTSLRFKAAFPNGNGISSDAQEVKVYVYGNCDWTASVSGEGASLDKTSGSGPDILTLTVPANTDTGNTKSYTVTVTTTADVPTKSYTLNLTQAKAVDLTNPAVQVYSFMLNTAGENLGSNGSYAGNCDVTISGITWNVTGVSNSGDYAGWRLGGKSITAVDRAIYSKTALPAEVTKIVVSHSRANISINSFTLTVHSSAAEAASGSNPVAKLTATVTVGTQDEPKTTTFEKADDTSWAGCYYRLAYNVTNSGSSNKYVEFRGLEIWGYPSE